MTIATVSPLRRLMPVLLLLAMVGPLTLNVFQPAMPSLVTAFGAPRETVQLTLSLYVLGMAVAQFFGGPLADRFGRRPVAMSGLALYTLASAASIFAPSIGMLIAARIAQAFGATMCLALSRTIIGDVSDRNTTARMIAYMTMVMVLAPMAAPNIGAALDSAYGWRAICVFCTLFGIAVLAGVAIFLTETRPAAMADATYAEVGRRSWRLVKNPAFLRFAGIASFATACFFIFLGATPHLVIEVFGRSPQEFALWYILLGVGYSLGNFSVGRFTHIFGPERMMVIGGFFAIAGTLCMVGFALADVRHPAAVFGPAVGFTFGNGLVLPHSMAGAIQVDRNAGGAASGLMGFAQMGLGAAGSYLVSMLPDSSALAMALMMLVCALISLFLTPWRALKA